MNSYIFIYKWALNLGKFLMCLLVVNCSSLTDPNNGTVNCSLGDDEVHSYEDTCSFTCGTSYGLIGISPRTCQSDGSQSGSDIMCEKSKYFIQLKLQKESIYNKMSLTVACENLNNPNNGVINCSLGDDENYTCIFTCNTGYELTGSDTRTCQSDGS